MKVSVWTSWNTKLRDGEPKCIFMGEVQCIPNPEDYIIVREEFGSERVKTITYDFISNEVEIIIYGTDPHNDYGPCLFKETKK